MSCIKFDKLIVPTFSIMFIGPNEKQSNLVGVSPTYQLILRFMNGDSISWDFENEQSRDAKLNNLMAKLNGKYGE